MKEVRVSDPTGTQWVVHRRWLPWRPRLRWLRRPGSGGSDIFTGLDLPADDFLGGFILAIVFVIVVAVILLFLLPIFVFVVEVVLFVVVVGSTALWRGVLRRPWAVEAESGAGAGGARLVWKVVGFRRSGQVVDEIADQLGRGVKLPVARGAVVVSAVPGWSRQISG